MSLGCKMKRLLNFFVLSAFLNESFTRSIVFENQPKTTIALPLEEEKLESIYKRSFQTNAQVQPSTDFVQARSFINQNRPQKFNLRYFQPPPPDPPVAANSNSGSYGYNNWPAGVNGNPALSTSSAYNLPNGRTLHIDYNQRLMNQNSLFTFNFVL